MLHLTLKHREGSQGVLNLVSFRMMVAVVLQISQPSSNSLTFVQPARHGRNTNEEGDVMSTAPTPQDVTPPENNLLVSPVCDRSWR